MRSEAKSDLPNELKPMTFIDTHPFSSILTESHRFSSIVIHFFIFFFF